MHEGVRRTAVHRRASAATLRQDMQTWLASQRSGVERCENMRVRQSSFSVANGASSVVSRLCSRLSARGSFMVVGLRRGRCRRQQQQHHHHHHISTVTPITSGSAHTARLQPLPHILCDMRDVFRSMLYPTSLRYRERGAPPCQLRAISCISHIGPIR